MVFYFGADLEVNLTSEEQHNCGGKSFFLKKIETLLWTSVKQVMKNLTVQYKQVKQNFRSGEDFGYWNN